MTYGLPLSFGCAAAFSWRRLVAIAALAAIAPFGRGPAEQPLAAMTEAEIVERIEELEGGLETGEVTEVEAALFKARVAARKSRLVEPPLTESEQGVLRNLALREVENRSAALATALMEIDEDSTAAYNHVAAGYYAERGDWEEAIRHYEEAVKRFPRFKKAHRNLGVIYARQGQWNRSRVHLLRTVALSGSADSDVLGLLGLCYLNTEEWTTAEMYYRQALEFEDSETWRFGLARALLRQEKFDQAIALLEALRADELVLKRPKGEAALAVAELDVKPKAMNLNVFEPWLPESRIAGEVTAEFLVTDEGEVIDVRIVESSSKELEASVVEALRASRWQPGMLEGEAVSVRVRQRFQFDSQVDSEELKRGKRETDTEGESGHPE